ncbi:CAN5-like protein [Mya arenaria]|uniref:CAN5-like protein n=1 Tax=Mya arenaria TaxID=6604 RepID=A0ABY7GEY9_MYAAR|nr:CAN5-like protein [Mya arenaria]
MPTNYKNQKYSSIKSDCLKKGELFEDPEFPANSKSLFYIEGATNDDLQEGEIGNTWFVIPDLKSQEFNEKSEKPSYAGVFQFRFWRYGEWVDVVVDDRLPTKDKELIFCHSKQTNEFWSALLEKAYANDTHSQLGFFEKLKDALDNHALVNCNIQCSKDDIGSETAQGLILGHGYNITNVIQIEVPKKLQGKIGQKILYMLRLANPWNVKEWNGPWSDGADEWNALTAHEWSKIGLKFENEGEFCLKVEENRKYRVHINGDLIFKSEYKRSRSIFGTVELKKGRYVLFPTTKDPGETGKYMLRLYTSSPASSNGTKERHEREIQKGCTKERYEREIRKSGTKERYEREIRKRDTKERYERAVRKSGTKERYEREIRKSGTKERYEREIQKGCTKERYEREIRKSGTKELYERAVRKRDTKERYERAVRKSGTKERYEREIRKSGTKELYEREIRKSGTKERYERAARKRDTKRLYERVGTHRRRTGCVMLRETSNPRINNHPIDPYVKIYCEGEKVVSEKLKQTASPEWNVKATFYRKKPDLEPITVEIWNGNVLIDDFMAEARVDIEGNEEGEKKKCDIFGRKKEKDVIMPGNLHVLMKSSHDLAYL